VTDEMAPDLAKPGGTLSPQFQVPKHQQRLLDALLNRDPYTELKERVQNLEGYVLEDYKRRQQENLVLEVVRKSIAYLYTQVDTSQDRKKMEVMEKELTFLSGQVEALKALNSDRSISIINNVNAQETQPAQKGFWGKIADILSKIIEHPLTGVITAAIAGYFAGQIPTT